MFSKPTGASSGLTYGAATSAPLQPQVAAQKKQHAFLAEAPMPLPINGSYSLDELEDVFEKRPASPALADEPVAVSYPPRPRSPKQQFIPFPTVETSQDAGASPEDLNPLCEELREIHRQKPAPSVVLPQVPRPRRPALSRTRSFHADLDQFPTAGTSSLFKLSAEPRKHGLNQAKVEDDGREEEFLQSIGFPTINPLAEFRASQLRKRQSALVCSPSLSQLLDALVKTHPAQSALPASQKELLEIFRIPYRFMLMRPEQAHPHLTPEQVGVALKTAKTVAVGDMHASYYKLMETLVAADMVEMPSMVARKLVLLANLPANHSLKTDQYGSIYEELKQIVPQMKWKGGDRQLILIGDMLSDRGPLDTITLDIVKHLSQQAPNSIVRMASNHDHNALNYLLNEKHTVLEEQAVSLTRARDLAMANHNFEALATNLFDYLAQSKLLHFDPVSQTLFSHAPITDAQLHNISPLLGLGHFGIAAFNADPETFPLPANLVKNPKDIVRFVDAANQFYTDYVRENQRVFKTYMEDFEKGEANGDVEMKKLQKLQAAVESILVGEHGFLWARNTLNTPEKLPFHQAGVKTLVHGHDSQSAQGSIFSLRKQDANKHPDFTVVNLDQNIRKGTHVSPANEESPLFMLP